MVSTILSIGPDRTPGVLLCPGGGGAVSPPATRAGEDTYVDNSFRRVCHPQRVVKKGEKTEPLELMAAPGIEKRIFAVRGRQVLLDEDLADLYGVETKRLIEQVKRNLDRFPEDFMFQLDNEEAAALRSQIATSSTGRGGRRYAPYVFTEQGVAMLSSVLRSKRAIAVNIEIMRAFVELRRVASSYAGFKKRLEQLERRMGEHDDQLGQIFNAMRQLIAPPEQPKRPIGFRVRDEDT
jgi:hypothetical protein